ncbi:MAG: hypothetical protein WBD74_06515 [Candidatus Aquilonibacter sp.]
MIVGSAIGLPVETNPIGDASDRGWDKKNCWTFELFSHANGRGLVATARESTCDFGFGLDGQGYYIFVRKAHERNSRASLAFSFDQINEETPPPILRWLSPSKLQVSYAGEVSPVIKQHSLVNGVAIQYVPTQPYATLSLHKPGLGIAPPANSDLVYMTFDLLPLPVRAPDRPFSQTGEFSVFGCDDEDRAIARLAQIGLERTRQHLEAFRRENGHYPDTVGPVFIRGLLYSNDTKNAVLRPSAKAPSLRVIYHPLRDTYALELRFPDLHRGYEPSTEHEDSNPGRAFVDCTAIHFGSMGEITRAGGFVGANQIDPPMLFTPRLGVYTYKP